MPWQNPRVKSATGQLVDIQSAIPAIEALSHVSVTQDAAAIAEVARRSALPVAVWTGGLGDSLFDLSPRTWTNEAWQALAAGLAAMPGPVLLRPHCRHVLADPMRTLKFLRERQAAGAPCSILLEPAALLTPSMLDPRSLDDHLTRALEMLGAAADAILLSNVRAPANPADDLDAPLALTGLAEGAIDPERLLGLIRRICPDARLVAHAADLDGLSLASRLAADRR